MRNVTAVSRAASRGILRWLAVARGGQVKFIPCFFSQNRKEKMNETQIMLVRQVIFAHSLHFMFPLPPLNG